EQRSTAFVLGFSPGEKWLRLGELWSIFLNQFVAIVFSFFFCSLLPEQRELLQQVWNFHLVAGFAQGLDQAIEGGLIFRIAVQRSPALLNGFVVLSRL